MTGVLTPPSTQGGITPGQQQQGQFQNAEQDIKNAAAFGSHGMGLSTGATQADVGAGLGQSLFDEQMSQLDSAAQTAYNNMIKQSGSNLAGGLGGLLGRL